MKVLFAWSYNVIVVADDTLKGGMFGTFQGGLPSGPPRPPPNAFLLFSAHYRNVHKGKGVTHKLVGEEWKRMSDKDKAPWRSKATELHDRYKATITPPVSAYLPLS